MGPEYRAGLLGLSVAGMFPRSISPPASPFRPWSLMLINLLPDFLAVLDSSDRLSAYHQYFNSHKALLEAYWDNYVVDPAGPHFQEVARSAVSADRSDLRQVLQHIDVIALANATERQCASILEIDVDIDIVLMVGVGAANAGELVVEGRGIAFVCLEHFTGALNPDTQGLGLDPELIPLWLAHEISHTVRYTSPTSHSEFRHAIEAAGGYYSYWDTGQHVLLRELLINEGLAVHTSRAVSPGHATWEYYGFSRRQYGKIRELEQLLDNAIVDELDRSGLGLRLRYLSGGMSDDARRIDRHVIPERTGYYVGAKMVSRAVAERGLAWSIRASADDIGGRESSAAASA